jgi:hypothetical protein
MGVWLTRLLLIGIEGGLQKEDKWDWQTDNREEMKEGRREGVLGGVALSGEKETSDSPGS